MTQRRLVILGSSLTALAVVRNAYQDRIPAIVFDVRKDVACLSRLARSVVISPGDEARILGQVLDLAEGRKASLIATSDSWLAFIVRNRDALTEKYCAILHPSNHVLEVCIDKRRFCSWCSDKKLPSPRFFSDPSALCPPMADQGSENIFPLLLRPVSSGARASTATIPKATEVRTPVELSKWRETFRQAGVDFVVTESLLGRDLVQYSVGAARHGNRTASFVAEKVRPTPQVCAVGTYVRLSPNKDVSALAQDALETLDYYGIAEIEVLHARDTGRNYLIEINPRPWIQYSLAPASGHDFLQFLTDPNSYNHDSEVKKGKAWINFGGDLFSCWSRSVGLVRGGHLGVVSYARSLVRANVFSRFQFNDLHPFVHGLKELAKGRAT